MVGDYIRSLGFGVNLNPKALRTYILKLLGSKTILYKAFGAILSLRVIIECKDLVWVVRVYSV